MTSSLADKPGIPEFVETSALWREGPRVPFPLVHVIGDAPEREAHTLHGPALLILRRVEGSPEVLRSQLLASFKAFVNSPGGAEKPSERARRLFSFAG